jgi:hypothetical protein
MSHAPAVKRTAVIRLYLDRDLFFCTTGNTTVDPGAITGFAKTAADALRDLADHLDEQAKAAQREFEPRLPLEEPQPISYCCRFPLCSYKHLDESMRNAHEVFYHKATK